MDPLWTIMIGVWFVLACVVMLETVMETGRQIALGHREPYRARLLDIDGALLPTGRVLVSFRIYIR